MARKQFLVVYQDGSKKHIGCAERDSLLLSGQIKKISDLQFSSTEQVRTCHAFADISKMMSAIQENPLRHFLNGSFTIELKGRRRRELLETPEAMAYRLTNNGGLTASCAT